MPTFIKPGFWNKKRKQLAGELDLDYLIQSLIPSSTTTTTTTTAPPYKVYSGLISQSGTNAPTLVVLQNTLGQTVTPNAYNLPGRYSLSVSGNILLNNKTWYTITNDNNNRTIFYIDKSNSLGNTSIVTIDTYSFNTAGFADGALQSTPFEIRVYN